MMNYELTSAQILWGDNIDRRYLKLHFDFYMLSLEELLCMSKECYTWIFEMLGERCIFQWIGFGGRTISHKAQKDKIFHAACALDCNFAAEGFVKSPIVHSLKTFRERKRRVFTYVPGLSSSVSADYVEYWNGLFPDGRPCDSEIIARIHQLFSEDRYMKGSVRGYDLSCCFFPREYVNHAGKYYGEFNFSIAGSCLGGHQNECANSFCTFACRIADQYKTLNAYVMLEPYSLEVPLYSRYFKGDYGEDDSHIEANCLEREWYRTYNLHGVEWANIISPLAQTHFDILPVSVTDIVVKKLHGGSILVKSAKPIDQFHILDAVEIKKILLPALYSGGSYTPLKKLFPKENPSQRSTFGVFGTEPRCRWENVPMLEGEIRISGNALVFSGL